MMKMFLLNVYLRLECKIFPFLVAVKNRILISFLQPLLYLMLNIDVELNDTKIKQKLYLNAEKVNLKAKILKYNNNKILSLSKVLINVDVEEI